MQTQRIRVGHGAVVCVPQMNHPIRVAERAAVLDILSGGRLEFGTARASTWTELGGFGVDPDTTKISWDEYVHLLPRLWTEERVAHDGATVSMPERPVLPKPVQEPHPPMWVTVTTPGTELDAADRGIGSLGVAAASFQEQERRTRHPVVATILSTEWGYRIAVADVTLSHRYDGATGRVALDGGVALLTGHASPRALSPSDLQCLQARPLRLPRRRVGVRGHRAPGIGAVLAVLHAFIAASS